MLGIKDKLQYFLIAHHFEGLSHIAYLLGQLYRRMKMPEQRKSFGTDNPDKTFYVIRQIPPGIGGILADYNYVILHMIYAYEKGWLPVVDMKNYPVEFSMEEPINGTWNAWEYFFEQPDGVTLDIVYKSKKVVLSSDILKKTVDESPMDREVLQQKYRFAKKIPLNEWMMQFIRDHAGDMVEVIESHDTIGVYYRGTLYKVLPDHPSPLTVEEMRRQIEGVEGYKKKKLFIVSDEQEPLDELLRLYPDALYTKHPRQQGWKAETHKSVTESKPKESHSIIENLLWYLTDVYLFSLCTDVVGRMNNGVYTAILWNQGKYESIHIQ